jgi:hypothetical protein
VLALSQEGDVILFFGLTATQLALAYALKGESFLAQGAKRRVRRAALGARRSASRAHPHQGIEPPEIELSVRPMKGVFEYARENESRPARTT